MEKVPVSAFYLVKLQDAKPQIQELGCAKLSILPCIHLVVRGEICLVTSRVHACGVTVPKPKSVYVGDLGAGSRVKLDSEIESSFDTLTDVSDGEREGQTTLCVTVCDKCHITVQSVIGIRILEAIVT